MCYVKTSIARLFVVSLMAISFERAVVNAVSLPSEEIDESRNTNRGRRLGGPLEGGESYKLYGKPENKEEKEKKEKKKGKMPFAGEGEVTIVVRTSSQKGAEKASKLGKGGKAKMDLQKLHVVVINVPEEEAEARIDELLKEEGILSAEYDFDVFIPEDIRETDGDDVDLHQTSMRINDPRRKLAEEVPYGIRMVNAEGLLTAAADAGLTPEPKTICVVDTGYDINHEDLPTSNVIGGMSVFGDDWFDDEHGHGTNCAGIIGAIGGNGLGVVGVIPDPSYYSFYIAKALDRSASGSVSGIMAAVNSCVEAGSDVISLSLSWSGDRYEDTFKDLYINDNVLFVASSGNSGKSNFLSPAAYDAAISVAAVDSGLEKAGFSTFNSQVELAGPGVSVLCTEPGNRYLSWSGTSMSAPHVSGVAALLWSYFPRCKNYQIRSVLTRTANDRGDSGCDEEFGYGIVDALAAFNLLKDGGCEAGDYGTEQPQGGCVEFFECDGMVGVVELTTDKKPKETSWDITNSMGDIIVQKTGFTEKESTHTTQFCKDFSGCATFTIRDSGDKTEGICCKKGEGSYTVTFDGKVVGSGGSFDGEEQIEFGCTPITNSPTKAPSTSPSTSPVASPTVSPFASPSMIPTMSPTISHAPISPPTTESPTTVPSRSPSFSPTTTAGPSARPTSAPSTSNAPTPSPHVATWEEIFTTDFESGWDNFEGGKKAKWKNKGKYFNGDGPNNNGKGYIKVKGNFPTSQAFTKAFDVSSYTTISVDVWYYCKSKKGTPEFSLEYEINDEATWTVVQTYDNREYYHAVEEFSVPDDATSMRIRFRINESSDKKDELYFDDVTVSGLTA